MGIAPCLDTKNTGVLLSQRLSQMAADLDQIIGTKSVIFKGQPLRSTCEGDEASEEIMVIPPAL